MRPGNFFAELKRRNVYKVAVAYAVVGWLLIQVATQVFPFFEIPNWAVRLVVLLLILGFPVSLILAWAFEITPEGIKRESDVEPNESVTAHTGRKLVGITVALAVIAASLLAYQLLRSRSSFAPRPKEATTSTTILPSAAIPDKSIAVLPFDNLSDEKANAYFAEGIQDEILTRLSKIAALKVISRTSTQKYKSAPDNLRGIGQELGVAHVLEGSVQKIANAVHVNVQLIKAATDEHLWAESYNRKLDDVFAVEGEVATAIADQLNAKLTGAEREAVTDRPTQNAAAYDAYLRGAALEHNHYGYDPYREVAADYADAVRLDPNFALAWARLAVVRSFLYFNGLDRNINTPQAVKEAVDRAQSLAPDAGESWIAEGAHRYRVLRDFEGAVTAYRHAQSRLPNNSYLLQNLGFVLRRLGRWDEAEMSFKKAAVLDPIDGAVLASMGGEFYRYLRRFGDAKASLDRALEIAPDSEQTHGVKASVLQDEGRLSEAAAELAQIPADSIDDFVLGARVVQAMYERHFETVVEVVERKLKTVPAGQRPDSFTESALVQSGFCLEWMGRHEDAVRAFTRAVEAIKPTPDSVVAPEANGEAMTLALAYAGLGEKAQALEQAQRAVTDYATDAINKPGAEIALAQIQARFGDLDSAINALPHLLEVPAGLNAANLKLDPLWDPLRNDKRFQKLLTEPPPATK